MNIEKLIDHSSLRPDLTADDIKQICTEAIDKAFEAVCIPPYYVQTAVRLLKNSEVKVTTVVGYPYGYSAVPAKVEEIKRALDEEVDEVDALVNVAALKNGDWSHVQNEIDSMTRAVKMKGKLIKILIGIDILTKKEIQRVCEICQESEVDFLAIYTKREGEPRNIKEIKTILSPKVKLKVYQENISPQFAQRLLKEGIERIGCQNALQIIVNLREES